MLAGREFVANCFRSYTYGGIPTAKRYALDTFLKEP
jgi:hypothetical protein